MSSSQPSARTSMRNLNPLSIASFALLHASWASAALTVYNAQATGTSGYDATQVSGLVSRIRFETVEAISLIPKQPNFDDTVLTAPAPPSPPITQITLSVPPTEDALTGQGYELGVKQRGNFLGLSIELSVADQISMYQSASRLYLQHNLNTDTCYFSGKESGQPESAVPQLLGQHPQSSWDGTVSPRWRQFARGINALSRWLR